MRYAGLTLTRIAPIFAVAYCVIVHSAQFGDHMPTRSPLVMPARTRPMASASTSRFSSAQVQRRPVANSTSASRSAYAATVGLEVLADRLVEQRRLGLALGVRLHVQRRYAA